MDNDGVPECARAQHTATLMPNGLVAVVGGFNGPTPTSELYDPATATWSLSGDMIRRERPMQQCSCQAGTFSSLPASTATLSSDPSSPEFDDFTLKETEIGTLQASPTPTPTPTPPRRL